MSLYWPDEVEITPVTIDLTYKTETLGIPFNNEAFIEDERAVIRNAFGDKMNQQSFIFLPAGVNIEENYYIRITKLHGKTVDPNSTTGIKLKVSSVFKVGDYKNSHIEIECESSRGQ